MIWLINITPEKLDLKIWGSYDVQIKDLCYEFPKSNYKNELFFILTTIVCIVFTKTLLTIVVVSSGVF